MKPIEKGLPVPSRRMPTRASLGPVRVAVPTATRRPSTLKRLAVTGAIGGGLFFAGFQLFSSPGTAQGYKTEKVTRETLVREVTASGPLAPAMKADVNNVVAGTVLAVEVDFGSEVEAGQTLARIDPAMANLSLREAEINLASSRTNVQVAKTRAEQSKTLMNDGLLPRIEYEKAVADLAQAEGSARIAEANVTRARIGIDRCIVRSPLKGVVITRNVSVGQSLETGSGALPLFVVASDLRTMQIEANIAESDIGGVRAGMDAAFTVDAFPDETFKGKVTQVRTVPVVDQTVVHYVALVETANPGLRLRPGMTASVNIEVARRENVLTIPNKALRFRPADVKDAQKTKDSGDAATVYRMPSKEQRVAGVDHHTPEKVSIKTGVTDGRATEVLEGLNEGDRLVVGLKQPDSEGKGIFARLPEILSGGSDNKKKGR